MVRSWHDPGENDDGSEDEDAEGGDGEADDAEGSAGVAGAGEAVAVGADGGGGRGHRVLLIDRGAAHRPQARRSSRLSGRTGGSARPAGRQAAGPWYG